MLKLNGPSDLQIFEERLMGLRAVRRVRSTDSCFAMGSVLAMRCTVRGPVASIVRILPAMLRLPFIMFSPRGPYDPTMSNPALRYAPHREHQQGEHGVKRQLSLYPSQILNPYGIVAAGAGGQNGRKLKITDFFIGYES